MQPWVPVRLVRTTRTLIGRAARAAHAAFEPAPFEPAPFEPAPFEPAAFSPPLQTRLLVLQPTPFCNLDCDYCYLPDRSNRARMSPATMRLAARRLVEDGLLGSRLTVVWHAGEPLVLPPGYYEAAFAALDDALGPDCETVHAFQTNGTLIDRRWCELFARHRVRVGISLDGPADLHDRHRRTRRGEGSHARVMAGLQRLREHRIPCHAIAVLGRESLSRAEDLHDFFTEAGVQEVGFSFDEIEGGHTASSLQGHEEEHLAFLARTLELSMQAGARYRVRELANALGSIAADPPTYRHAGRSYPENGQLVPFSIVTVGWDGSFSTFSPEWLGQSHPRYSGFALGNVADGSYLAATAGATFQRLWADLRHGVAACEAECSCFRYCGGGAPANKLYENGSLASAETLYCRTMIKRPLETVLRSLEPGGPACLPH